LHEGLDESQRGCYAGMGDKSVIEHLKALGITTIELLPIHHFVDDRFLVDKGLRNFWGYSTLNFFAPEQRYFSGDGSLSEVKQMVRKFHDAGIEVILDVVYNHTCEGDHRGPSLSFKGIDNSSYYRLLPNNSRYYINDTGCGNTLNLNHPRVLQMVLDSLRYWVTDMHIDGFRFDLATSLARDADGYNSRSAFLGAVGQDPVLSQIKLIAEPWDIGPGGYQLGAFPAPWLEWNDKYRDTIRRYWRGDEGLLADFASRVSGSADMFNHSGRGASSSVNFVTTHDGYTLMDTVSYRERHNEINGEDNRDGHNANYSDNYGVEGVTDDQSVNGFRNQQRRNMIATVLLSQGTPMILAGDEMGRTQQGNNNAYCQDNEINWIDWSLCDKDQAFLEFVKTAVALRKSEPLLRLRRFIGQKDSGVTATWCDPGGQPMTEQQWGESYARCVSIIVSADRDDSSKESSLLFMVFNASKDEVPMTIPAVEGVSGWCCRLNSAEIDAINELEVADNFTVTASSVAVFSPIVRH